MQAFEVHVEDDELADLARRLAATRWIEDPSEGEAGYGAPLNFVHDLCQYWAKRFDWRAVERRINAESQITIYTDGITLHAVHRRSTRTNAIPLLLIHGWPSSFLEFLGVCPRLAEPDSDDIPAFNVVIPSLPGYGYSTTRPGVSPRRIAAQLAELMTSLGYDKFMIQGGNWGSSVGTEMARQFPERVIGLHLNAVNGSPPSSDDAVVLSEEEQAQAEVYSKLLAYPHFNLLTQAPFATAHALNDSPAGMAAWIGEKLHDWADQGLPDNPGLRPDWMLATIALYWFTGTAASSAMLYREAALDPTPERFVTVPTAVAHFARETVMIPRPWAERHYNIVRWTKLPRGGHYAAIEVPDLFCEDVRTFATMLCGSGKAR